MCNDINLFSSESEYLGDPLEVLQSSKSITPWLVTYLLSSALVMGKKQQPPNLLDFSVCLLEYMDWEDNLWMRLYFTHPVIAQRFLRLSFGTKLLQYTLFHSVVLRDFQEWLT